MQFFIASVLRGRAGGRVRVSIGPWHVWHFTFATATWVRWEKKMWGGSRQTRFHGISWPFSPKARIFFTSSLLVSPPAWQARQSAVGGRPATLSFSARWWQPVQGSFSCSTWVLCGYWIG